ncbi:helix-turn-helix transcriptional regulator [Archangium sp.]|uniref:helix-turn-helix transcriptional regulator n=1 Tax=Archangium sp. TaxID=1872627 RepID=UPI002D2F7EB2|nr:helix-turn-helix transcriptional regulator [Archangium sp.]HYO51279.1 helix-turn-helix transcriptional regulator [Archangium sp.]
MPRFSARVERPLAMTLGSMAHAARMRAGLTLAEVARRVGVQLEVYACIERGEMLPSVPALRRICLALEIPSDELLGLDARQSSDLRRLLRAARGLKTSQLRMLHLLAESLHSTPRE